MVMPLETIAPSVPPMPTDPTAPATAPPHPAPSAVPASAGMAAPSVKMAAPTPRAIGRILIGFSLMAAKVFLIPRAIPLIV